MKNKLFKKRLKEAFSTLLDNIKTIPILWLIVGMIFLLIPILFLPLLITSFFSMLFPKNVFWQKMVSFFEFICEPIDRFFRGL